MKTASRNRPLNKDDILFNKQILRFRYKVERCFGALKRQYGFNRARYLRRLKTELELYPNAFVFNLKKFVLLVS
ncbi:MAG: transposase [Deltaproteobacteria bacterium]|nr:transposase [Deltaproteobacteria bacterium]